MQMHLENTVELYLTVKNKENSMIYDGNVVLSVYDSKNKIYEQILDDSYIIIIDGIAMYKVDYIIPNGNTNLRYEFSADYYGHKFKSYGIIKR